MGEAQRRAKAEAANTHDLVTWRQGERRMARSAAAELAKLDTPLEAHAAPTDSTRTATPEELTDLAAVRDEVVRNVLETDLPDNAILDIALSKSKQLVQPRLLLAFIRKLRVVRASRDQAKVPE